jgi:hypothetical protein
MSLVLVLMLLVLMLLVLMLLAHGGERSDRIMLSSSRPNKKTKETHCGKDWGEKFHSPGGVSS